MQLMLATRNPGKVREFERLLEPHEVASLPAGVELAPETGSTFAQNAIAKAEGARGQTGLATLADDSGISACALGGAPGVFSARFAGENATDEENLQRLLDELANHKDRRVWYVCVLCYAGPDGMTDCFVGRCTGTLAFEPRGQEGFGYDPAFVADDYNDGRTMAELSQAEKDAISHRGRAARSFLRWLAARH